MPHLQAKPIPHNGKEYWPDANGWYEMECAPKDGDDLLLFDKKHGRLKGQWVSFNECLEIGPLENTDDALTEGWYQVIEGIAHYDKYYLACNPTGWQPLPAGPVMEGG